MRKVRQREEGRYLQQCGEKHDGQRSHQLILAKLLNLSTKQRDQTFIHMQTPQPPPPPGGHCVSHLSALPDDLLEENEEVLWIPLHHLLQAPAVHGLTR